MRIVEDSYYEHDDFGLVKVKDVTNGVVSYEKYEDREYLTHSKITFERQQSAAGFFDKTEPANVKVEAKPAMIDFSGVTV